MAAVGSIESLLTLQLLDGIADDGTRGSTKREVIGQGVGNLAAGLTGGIGGCALIGQSIINAQSGGGVSRLSGVSMAVFLGLGIVGFAPLIGRIPVCALAGVMLLVCQSTFSWGSLRLFGKVPNMDLFTIALVTFVTVKDDLAKAVLIGTVSALFDARERQLFCVYGCFTVIRVLILFPRLHLHLALHGYVCDDMRVYRCSFCKCSFFDLHTTYCLHIHTPETIDYDLCHHLVNKTQPSEWPESSKCQILQHQRPALLWIDAGVFPFIQREGRSRKRGHRLHRIASL